MTKTVLRARGGLVWASYRYCSSVQVYAVQGDTPPPDWGSEYIYRKLCQ